MTTPEQPQERAKITARSLQDDPVVVKKSPTGRTLRSHPAGRALLGSAGIVTGIAVAPPLLRLLDYELPQSAADLAATYVVPWPWGVEPDLWPAPAAVLALAASLVVLLAGVARLKLPMAFFGLAPLVIGACLVFVAKTVLDSINEQDGRAIPVQAPLMVALVLCVSALRRWRRGGSVLPFSPGTTVVLSWLVVAAVIVGLLAAVRAANDEPVSRPSASAHTSQAG